MKRKRNKSRKERRHSKGAFIFMIGDEDVSSIKKIKTAPQKKSNTFMPADSFSKVLKQLDESGSMGDWLPHCSTAHPIIPSGELYNDPIFLSADSHSKIVFPRVVSKALVSMALPEIKIGGHGVLALRRWKFSDGWLASESQYTIWKEQMVADKPPTEENDNGLYGTEFSPEGLMSRGQRYIKGEEDNPFRFTMINFNDNYITGLIQMRGEIQNNKDCTLRAEWARIVCLFVPADETANKIVPALIKNYPTTPVYVLHDRQVAEVLFSTLEKRRQQDDDQFSD